MKVRLAALITTCAAGLLWYSEPLKSEDLAGVCVSSKAPRSEVVAACTSLIGAEDTTPEYRHLFLTERAWAHSCNGSYERAIADVDRALELQPENYKTRILRAQIHASNNEHGLAMADYDEAVEMGPEASFTHWRRARYLDEQGKNDEAYVGYQQVLELNANASNAAKHVVTYLTKTQQFQSAYSMATEAETKWPDQTWVYEEQVKFHVLRTGNSDQALDVLDRLFASKPNSKYELLGRALIHLQIGDENKGIQFVEAYAELDIGKWNEEQSYPNKIERFIWGRSEDEIRRLFLTRGLLFELLGRRDLARVELHRMFNETGSDGEGYMRDLLARLGVSSGLKADQSGISVVDQLINVYLDHEPPRVDWLPEREG